MKLLQKSVEMFRVLYALDLLTLEFSVYGEVPLRNDAGPLSHIVVYHEIGEVDRSLLHHFIFDGCFHSGIIRFNDPGASWRDGVLLQKTVRKEVEGKIRRTHFLLCQDFDQIVFRPDWITA